MTLMLELPPELESELAAEAARLNLSLQEYALRVLATGRETPEQPRTGAELVAYWEQCGAIGSRPDIVNGQEHARELRQQAQLRKRD